MKHIFIPSFSIGLAISPFSVASESNTTGQKPNIIVILTDDVGYGSAGFNGATKVRTPNIEKVNAYGRYPEVVHRMERILETEKARTLSPVSRKP